MSQCQQCGLRHGELFKVRRDYNDRLLDSGGKHEHQVNTGSCLPHIEDDFKEYYQKKLDAYWITQMDKSISKKHIHKALDYLKGNRRCA